MPDDIRTRTAGADDLDAVLSVYEVLKGPWPDAGPQLSREIWNEILALPGTDVFVAEGASGIMAAATLHVMPNLTCSGSPYALIENVAVARKLQGRGIGRIIMEAVIERARAAGCYKVMLLTGNHNGAAEFYRKLGFDENQKNGMVIRYAPKRA